MYYNKFLKQPLPLHGIRTNLIRSVVFSIHAGLMLVLSSCQTGTQTSAPINSASNIIGKNQLNPQQLADYKVALISLDNKDYFNAEKTFINLTLTQPGFPGSWVNLGLLNLLQKKPEAAEKYLDKALLLSPTMPQALNLMGLLAVHNRKISSAEKYYKMAIKSDNDYSNAHYNLALLYDIYLQDIENAIIHYQRYLTLVDNNDTTTLNWLNYLESSIQQ